MSSEPKQARAASHRTTFALTTETLPEAPKKPVSAYTNIEWPTIAEFNKEIGSLKIDELSNLWCQTNEWLFWTNYMTTWSDCWSTYYLYKVMWSIPTNPYPVPQATASVFFTLEVSNIAPRHHSVKVKWSTPTPAYIIPQAVASAFFTIDVSKIFPTSSTVQVSYVFEGSRFVHIPGKINFQEKWLHDIINSKVKLFKTITF